MKILSINFGHDASLSLFEDEEILDFLEIERVSRLKHHFGINSTYIEKFLTQNKISFADISCVSVTGTQNWPLCHTSDIDIDFKLINEHFDIFDNEKIKLIQQNNNFIETPNEITGIFVDHLKHQFIDKRTQTLNRSKWENPYIDGINVFEEDVSRVFNSVNQSKRYICSDFYFPITFSLNGIIKPGFYINHHAAHAFHAAKYAQNSSLIVTHDGGLSTVPFNSGGIYYYKKEFGLLPINSHNFAFGSIYDKISSFFSLTPGKLMGLASFGNASTYLQKLENIAFEIFNSPVNTRNDNIDKLVKTILDISKQTKSIRNHEMEKFNFNFSDTDFAIQAAANTQALVQSLFCKQVTRVASIIQNLQPKTKILMLTGGFTLNCPTNSQLSSMLTTFNIKPLPACGDTGLSIGGAVALNYLNKNKAVHDKNLNFNDAAFPISKLEKKLKNKNLQLFSFNKENLTMKVAEYLANNKIICINRGRSEVGPRALGNRSIISLATSSETRDLINFAKGRENWRPLAPICCDIDFNDYFEGEVNNSRFMLFTNKVKTNLTNAIKHVDNTARVQCLFDKNDWLYQSLQILKTKGFIPVIINTSFNCAGEPIVESFEQSYDSFKKMNFDYLIFDNYIIENKTELNLNYPITEFIQ